MIFSVYPNEDITKLDLTKFFTTRKGTKINQNNYLKRVKAICRELNITSNIKTHSFRKYFRTQITMNKEHVSLEFCEHLMGHISKNLGDNYNMLVNNRALFFEEWIKLQNLICIDCITIDNTSKLVNEHELELKKKEQQIDDLQNRLLEMELVLKSVGSIVDRMQKRSNETIEEVIKLTIAKTKAEMNK